MYFLIDHENVTNNGYKGTEFLLPEDTIEIFYSNSCKNIMLGLFEDMEMAGCNIKICKLYQTRKMHWIFILQVRWENLLAMDTMVT